MAEVGGIFALVGLWREFSDEANGVGMQVLTLAVEDSVAASKLEAVFEAAREEEIDSFSPPKKVAAMTPKN